MIIRTYMNGLANDSTMVRSARLRACQAIQFYVEHSTTEHHDCDWPTIYRGDKHIHERLCPHGIGHPDPGDHFYAIFIGKPWLFVHGCDGCCG